LLALSLVYCSSTAFGQATIQRPIKDFIDAQIGFYSWNDPETGNIFTLDYLGRWNDTFALSLGTTLTGTVTEQPLADGRARVRVDLRTENALTYVTYPGLGVVFGHSLGDVSAGKEAGLGSSTLTVDFINTAPGAPLPDITAFNAPGRVLNKLSFNAKATGTLRASYGVPDGTPGMARTNQRGLFGVPGMPTNDVYPVEFVRAYPIED
jgi:hypothetical protein